MDLIFCLLVCLEDCVTQTVSEYNAFKEKEISIILIISTSLVWVFSFAVVVLVTFLSMVESSSIA